MSWFVASVAPQFDGVVCAELARRGFEVWLPICRVRRRHRRGIVTVNEPLFPGYQFVQLASSRELWSRTMSQITGINGLLGNSAGPIAVPDEQLAEVRKVVERHAELIVINGQPRRTHLLMGDAVAIVGGWFDGFHGVFCEARGAGRIKILLDVLGGSQVVVIPEARVIPV